MAGMDGPQRLASGLENEQMRRITFILQMTRDKKGFFAFSFLSFFLSFFKLNFRFRKIISYKTVSNNNWNKLVLLLLLLFFLFLLLPSFLQARQGVLVSGYPGFFIQVYGIFVSHYGYKVSPFSKLSVVDTYANVYVYFFTYESVLTQWSKYANHWEISQRLAHGQRSYGEFALFYFGLFLVWFGLFVCFCS